KAVFLDIDHPVLACFGLDFVDRGVLPDQLSERLGDDQELEDSGPAKVASSVALRANLLRILRFAVENVDLFHGQIGLLEEVGLGLVRLLADIAEDSDQTLS